MQPRRLRRLDHIWANLDAYFLTTCTEQHIPCLATNVVCHRFEAFSSESLERYGIWVDAFVLMPDHLHVIVTASPDSFALGAWVKALKAMLSLREFKWQAGFFDHVLRSDESRSEKWEYIRMNPVRAGLLTNPSDWPYQAYFHRMDGRQVE